jgi:hypothetical protein
VFLRSYEALLTEKCSKVFELSTVFLSIRNIATCYSLGKLEKPIFSRDSALRLGQESLPLPLEPYEILARSRMLCTRGDGLNLKANEIQYAIAHLACVGSWMERLVEGVRQDERI